MSGVCHVGSDSMSGWGRLLMGFMLDHCRDATYVGLRCIGKVNLDQGKVDFRVGLS